MDVLVIIVDTKNFKIMAVPTAGSLSCRRGTTPSGETVLSYTVTVRTFLWNSFTFTVLKHPHCLDIKFDRRNFVTHVVYDLSSPPRDRLIREKVNFSFVL
jgi:hypothetical protein